MSAQERLKRLVVPHYGNLVCMPRGVTESPYSRRQRRERAFVMFAKGYRNVDVQRSLKVSSDTVRRFRRAYEEHLQQEVSDNPRMLTDVLGNTVRTIEEIDLVRKDAWSRLDAEKHKRHVCEECGCHLKLPTSEAVALEKVILDASRDRMRLFGLLGVKQEYFLHVQRVQMVQAKIIQFLQTELCDDDRRKFDSFMMRELPSGSSEIIDAEEISA